MRTSFAVALGVSAFFLGCGDRALDLSDGNGAQGGAAIGGAGGGGAAAEGGSGVPDTGTGGRDPVQAGGSGGGGKGGSAAGGTGGGGKGGSAAGGTGVGGKGGVTGGGKGGSAPGGRVGTGGNFLPPPLPGVIIYMKFDEGAASTVKDHSGNVNDGAVQRGMTDPSPPDQNPRWSPGRTGAVLDRSLELNGVDEWVRIPPSNSIEEIGINNEVTISIWVYVNQITVLKPYNDIVQRHILGTRGEHFQLGMLNGVPFAGQNHMGTTGPADMRLGEWVHMALTFDSLTLSLYVNGGMVSWLDTGTPISPDETPVSLGAGINEADVQEFVNGRLDEFQLYGRALTQMEVARLAGR